MALSEIEKLNKQIADLEEQKIEVLKKSKTDVKNKITYLLEKSGFTLVELFPTISKKKITSDGSKVKVNGKVYKLPKSGIGKSVEKALVELNLNPNDYDRQKLLAEFSV